MYVLYVIDSSIATRLWLCSNLSQEGPVSTRRQGKSPEQTGAAVGRTCDGRCCGIANEEAPHTSYIFHIKRLYSETLQHEWLITFCYARNNALRTVLFVIDMKHNITQQYQNIMSDAYGRCTGKQTSLSCMIFSRELAWKKNKQRGSIGTYWHELCLECGKVIIFQMFHGIWLFIYGPDTCFGMKWL